MLRLLGAAALALSAAGPVVAQDEEELVGAAAAILGGDLRPERQLDELRDIREGDDPRRAVASFGERDVLGDRGLGLGLGDVAALFGIALPGGADYAFRDGSLIPSGGGGGLASIIPLLGGALSVGQIWPQSYASQPLDDYQQDYYGFEDPDAYRYADNVVYQVDPGTSAIESVVALLSGSNFAVGEQMPEGYDVYNVPADYQDRYADSDEAMYRYDDGRVYEIDPASMLVEKVIELIA